MSSLQVFILIHYGGQGEVSGVNWVNTHLILLNPTSTEWSGGR